ncbi:MAG: DUF4397 domain-containing protein [Chitinophagaceae bacterium]|nr:MAG: DUF4397 domain-containing protein [Chitinophagaceae bacterium]
MNKIKNKCFNLLCLALVLLTQACKKDKIDAVADNRTLTVNRANSTARVINFAGYSQVIANGDKLTGFIVLDPRGPDYYKYPGTSYFPTNGMLGKTWNIPQDLFNAKETVQLNFQTLVDQGANLPEVNLDVKNDHGHPTDYFLMPTSFMQGQPAVVPIERGVSAPSKPDHFKIRIINLSGEIINKGFNSSGPLEDLRGDVSLAYADGTLVSAQTNNVSATQKASAYIELPYGTYQFKVLTPNGRQLPALGSEDYNFTLLDPPTSTVPRSLMQSTNLTYAPTQTYQPGGTYTIVVAPQSFNYFINEMAETTFTYQNSFQIISDQTASTNHTYFRANAVNAWDSQNVSFRLNGKPFATDLAFGAVGEYANFVNGKSTIDAVDASGKVLASIEQDLRAAQNYTAWLYADQAGAAKMLMVANDLSASIYNAGTQDDATFTRRQQKFPFFKRFLNFSADNPYITFTLNNGQPVSNANTASNSQVGVNMQPGIPLFESPFTVGIYSDNAFELMAYRSKPNVVPGAWANDIPVLKNDAFITNKNLYSQVSRALPVQEAGIYTVALIGKTSSTNAQTKAKMIIVKHNK